MREMTTAEFAKANLAALEEPVSIRRYTKTVGTYYPEGYVVAGMPEQSTLALEAPQVHFSTEPELLAKVVDLELEVKRLKQELAKRPLPAVEPMPVRTAPVAVERLRAEDPFAGLAKQDREFFERKLGTKKK